VSSGASIEYLDDYIGESSASPLTQMPNNWLSEFENLIRNSFLEQNVILPDQDTVKQILKRVRTLHRAGDVIASADNLLQYVVELLDRGNFHELDLLIYKLTHSIDTEADLYDDRGLARVHNLLALTFRHEASLPRRGLLRSKYHERVTEREGQYIADNAVANL
jgi:hypothetical protein